MKEPTNGVACVARTVLLLLSLTGVGCGPSVRSTDKTFWDHYEKGFGGLERACLYSSQRESKTFGELLEEVLSEANRLSAEFDNVHYGLPDDHPLAQRARQALERIKPQLLSRVDQKCSTDRRFDLNGITTHVIAHDVPAAFSFPNGRVYLTTGLIDPQLPWAAQTDDELLGVVAHEAIHLVDYHVVVHWAVIRQRHAEKIATAPLVLTWILPVRIVRRPLPLGAETYDKRIEFLADSGAAEVLRGLGRDPQHYRRFLGRLADYPYFAAIEQPQRKDLLTARTACLGFCLSPSAAKMRMEGGAVRSLTSRDQFEVCTKSYVAAAGKEWLPVAAWLERPDSLLLNDLPEQLRSEAVRAALDELIAEKSKQIEAPKGLARALLGARAQLEEGCPFGDAR
jgi:hypothetical protein